MTIILWSEERVRGIYEGKGEGKGEHRVKVKGVRGWDEGLG